eukprot:881483-Amphidinium_carterae.1
MVWRTKLGIDIFTEHSSSDGVLSPKLMPLFEVYVLRCNSQSGTAYDLKYATQTRCSDCSSTWQSRACLYLRTALDLYEN